MISCDGLSDPTFDPFDDLFAVDIEQLRADTTIKSEGDCMAFRLIKDHGEHQTNYGIYINIDSIVSKGLTIPLRTPKPLPITSVPVLSHTDTAYIKLQNNYIDSIKRLPFDTIKVDSILRIYNLVRKEIFSKKNTFFNTQDYFLICESSLGQEYLFEYKFEPHWLGRRAFGQRLLFFETTITRASLEKHFLYHSIQYPLDQ